MHGTPIKIIFFKHWFKMLNVFVYIYVIDFYFCFSLICLVFNL